MTKSDEQRVHTFLGTFLKNISNNATFTFSARYGNSSESETGTRDFCKCWDGISQPDPYRELECPPEKGFAYMTTSFWVMPMFIVPVRPPERIATGQH